ARRGRPRGRRARPDRALLAAPGATPGGLLAGHQRDPAPAWAAGELQTAAGALLVILQIAAVMALAVPSTPLATGVEGSRIWAATWAQVRPARLLGRY